MDKLDNLVGERIRELRIKAGLSQEKLGEAADLHFSYIGQIERGEKSPSLRTVISIARALEVPVSRLLDPDDGLDDGKEAWVQQFRVLAADHTPEDIQLCLRLCRSVLDHCRRLRDEH